MNEEDFIGNGLISESRLWNFEVTLNHPNAKVPTRQIGSVGYDLYAVEDVILPSVFSSDYSSRLIDLGISVAFEGAYGAFLWDRSGMGVKSIRALEFAVEEGPLMRLAGCIEGTFRGNWKVVLLNLTNKEYKITAGDRVAQVCFCPVEFPVPKVVDKLKESIRGTFGFGSSGK